MISATVTSQPLAGRLLQHQTQSGDANDHHDYLLINVMLDEKSISCQNQKIYQSPKPVR